jgi:2-oxoglutarate ferredoxin oxidoreductase subunit alpha
MDGNQALAYGLIAAGVRYGAGYPITPWSTIMETCAASSRSTAASSSSARMSWRPSPMALGFSYAGHLAITGSAAPASPSRWRPSAGPRWRRCPSSSSMSSAAAPAPACRPMSSRATCYQAIYGGHGDSPARRAGPQERRGLLLHRLEAARIARKYSTPVFILSDQALATRIEAFDEPDLKNLMVDPDPTSPPRGADFKPYPLDGITRTRLPAPACSMASTRRHRPGARRNGPPHRQPGLHAKMTAKRREKLKAARRRAAGDRGPRRRRRAKSCWSAGARPGAPSARPSTASGRRPEGRPALHLRHLQPAQPPDLERDLRATSTSSSSR